MGAPVPRRWPRHPPRHTLMSVTMPWQEHAMFKASLMSIVATVLSLPAAAANLDVGDAAPDLHVSRWWNGPAPGRLAEPGAATTVLTFWATWSQPARESLAALGAL